MGEFIPKRRLRLSTEITLAICVLLNCILNRLEHLGKLLISIKHNDCNLGVSPAAIAEQLVDGVRELLRARPKFAFGNKDILSL